MASFIASKDQKVKHLPRKLPAYCSLSYLQACTEPVIQTVLFHITKYGSTQYIGIGMVIDVWGYDGEFC